MAKLRVITRKEALRLVGKIYLKYILSGGKIQIWSGAILQHEVICGENMFWLSGRKWQTQTAFDPVPTF